MSTRPTVECLLARVVTQPVGIGAGLSFVGYATDLDGDLLEHWMELKNPEGKWSWEAGGDAPDWNGGTLGGDGYSSKKGASFTFQRPGTWLVRSTANDKEQPSLWSESVPITITVVGDLPPVEPPDPATVSFNGGPSFVQAVGDKLVLGSTELAELRSEGPYDITFKAQDVVTPPVSELWPMDADAVSNRLGPKWDGADAASRPTNPAPTTKHSDIPYARAQNYEFGTPSVEFQNFWSETGNGIVARKTKTDLNSFRIQTYAAYNSVAVSRPNGDITGFKPDPVHASYKLTLPFTCVCRSQGIECNEALMGNAAGDIWPSGTQTSRGSDDWPYPTCNVGFEITAMALTTSNELLVVVGINPKTGAGKIAYVACEGKWLPSHTMQRTAQPNQGSWSGFRLLGVRDLPFDFPNSVAAAANGSWAGPSQTASQDLGQINLEQPWVRASLAYEGEQDDQPWGWIFATKGCAVVTSKVAGKAVTIDLSAFFKRVRFDYTQPDQAAWESILKKEDAGLYPPTFNEDGTLEPLIAGLYDVKGPNFVCCVVQHERWSKDLWKAWIAGEDGFLTVLDTSPLLSRYSWEPVGKGGILTSKFIAKNLTHVTLQRYSDWRAQPHMPIDPNTGKNDSAFGSINGIIVTSRGENAHIFLVSVGEQLIEYLRLEDTRAEDLIACTVNERSFIVTSVDFGKKRGRIINWVMNGVSSDAVKDGWFNLPNPPGSTDETNLWYFLGGEPLEFDDDEHPVLMVTANVN